VHFATTSRSVWGAYQYAETQDLPFQVTYGYSKDKRPDLKQFILSTLCVDRAVPIWGKPEDGNASDKTLNTTVLSEIAQLLAQYGVQPGAFIYVADAALVTEDNLAALGDTLFITRLPATYPTFKGVWYAAVNLAPLPLLDTKPDQCPRLRRRADDGPGCHGPGGLSYSLQPIAPA
jgi:transposase